MTLDSLYIIMAIQYVFWAIVFLFIKKENKLANFFFGSYLLMQGIMFYYFYQAYSEDYTTPSLYLQLYWIASAAHTPFLFLYIVHFLQIKRIPLLKISLHFIPAITITTIFMAYYLSLDTSGQIELTKIHMSGESHNYLSIYLYSHITLALQNLFYIIASVRHVLNYQKKILLFSANIPYERIQWLKQLIILSQIINIGGFVVFDLIPATPALRYYPAVHLLLVYFIMYKAVNQAKIFKHHSSSFLSHLHQPTNDILRNNPDELIETVKSILITHRLYADSELNIINIAEALNKPTSDISNALQYSPFKNFYQLVNAVRISELTASNNREMIENRSPEDIADTFGFSTAKQMQEQFKQQVGIPFLDYKAQLITKHE